MKILSLGQTSKALAAVAIVVIITVSAGVYLYYRSSAPVGQAVQVKAQVSPFLLEYPTPGIESLPNAIAIDSSGNVWTVLQNRTELAEFVPATSSFKLYSFPEPAGTLVMTWGIAIDNQRHLVWVADETSDAIWSFNMVTAGFTKTPLRTVGATPYQLVIDSKGNVWFTEFVGDKIGVISTDGLLAEIQIPLSGNPTGITVDSQGRIWFNLLQTGGLSDLYYIGSYFEGSFSFYNLTNKVDTPVGIAVDANGNVWLTQHGASLLSEYNPTTQQIRTFSTSIPEIGASLPYFVYVDQQTGSVWFNEHYGNALGEFNPSSGQMVEYHLSPGPTSYGNISGILTMNLTPSGAPWFIEVYTGKIGTLNSTTPLNLSVGLNATSPLPTVPISNASATSLRLRITSNTDMPISLTAAVGNATDPLQFSFSPASGSGTFASTMTITDSSTSSGVYFVTISAATEGLTVSQVIELRSVD